MAAGCPTVQRRLMLAAVGAVLGFGLIVAPPSGDLTRASAASYAKPSRLGATVSANAVGLHWTTVKGAPAYRVQFSTRSDMKAAQTKDVVGSYLEWTHLNPDPSARSARLKPSTTYYFRVKVISLSKASLTGYGTKLKVKTASAKSMAELAPVSLKASVQSRTSSYISWKSRGPGVQYRIRYGKTSKLELGKSKLASSTTSATVLKGLASGAKYYFKVRVLSSAGAYLSGYSKTASFTVSKTYASPAITVATYNVCSVACDASAHLWTERQPAVIANIAAQSPDIIGLQEMDRSKFADVLDGLNAASSRAYVGSDPPSRGGSGTTKLAFDSQRFEMATSDHGSVALPTGESGTTKYAAWAILSDKLSGKKLFVVSAHLVVGAEWQELRKLQTADLVALVAAKNTEGLPVVIAGDFNSGRSYKPSNVIYDVLSQAGYREPLGNTNNSWAIASTATSEHRANLDYNTFNGFDAYARRSKYDNGPDIDYIWHSPKIRVALTSVAVNVDTAGRFVGLIPSDHNLLTVTIHLP